MTQSKRSHRFPVCTRRGKLLCGFLFTLVLFFVFVINVGFFSSSNGAFFPDKICKLEEIETIEDFDKKKFSGTWFGMHTKGLDSSVLAYFIQFYDVRADFSLNKEGNFDLKTIGSKFYGMWCPVGIGHASSMDSNSPQKLLLSFDTPTGKKFGTKPAWLLATDYTSYAIIYSCWKETDGSCDHDNSYVFLLQRNKRPLATETRATIDGILSAACVNPKLLKPLPHYGYCIKDDEEIPDE